MQNQNDEDLLKYVERMMNEDRFFNEIKMVISAGYVSAYVYLQKGEKDKAREIAAVLGDLARECSPLVTRAMGRIEQSCRKAPRP